jgi:hypothetical protein
VRFMSDPDGIRTLRNCHGVLRKLSEVAGLRRTG